MSDATTAHPQGQLPRLPAMPHELPPGAPMPVAEYRPKRGDWRRMLAICLALFGGFAVLRGLRWDGPWDSILVPAVLIVGGSVLIAYGTARVHLVAGPGWLYSRDMFRRRWVRTDQLVKVKSSTTGTGSLLTLRDASGRTVQTTLLYLRMNPALAEQVAHDVRRSVANGLVARERTLALLLGTRSY